MKPFVKRPKSQEKGTANFIFGTSLLLVFEPFVHISKFFETFQNNLETFAAISLNMSLKAKMFRFNETQQFYSEIELHSDSGRVSPFSFPQSPMSTSTTPSAINDTNDVPVPDEKPGLHISQINAPQNCPARELFDELYEGNPSWYLYAKFEKIVTPKPNTYFSTAQSIFCDVQGIVYNEIGARCSVDGLEFHLLGHGFREQEDKIHDFSSYSSSVTSIDFSGHMSYVTPAFQIMRQLKSLKKVKFNVGFNQHPFFLENMDQEYYNIGIEPNPSVETLKVKINNSAFASGGSQISQTVILEILDLIFYRASNCFPNLRKLDLQLPASNVTAGIFKKIVYNAQYHTTIKMSINIVAADVGLMMLNCLLPTEGKVGRSLLAPLNEPFDAYIKPDTLRFSLKALFNKLDDLSELLEEWRNVEVGRKLMGDIEKFPVFVINPPPKFQNWFVEVCVFNVNYTLPNCPNFQPPTKLELINKVLKSLIVSPAEISVHRELMKESLPMSWVDKVGQYLGIETTKV